jgi:septin family protein
MPQIAIIKPKLYSDGYDDYTKIIDSISDWSEVSNEELKLLKSYCNNYDYEVIERVDTKPEFIIKTIQQALIEAKKHEEQRAKQKAEAEQKKLERALKKKAKDVAQELKLLAELQAKHSGKLNKE